MLSHTIIKLLTINGNKKLLKTARGVKRYTVFKEINKRMAADFPKETMQIRT